MISFFKQTVALLLVAVFLLQASSKFIVLVDYTINKEYITKVLCVNKDKPKMCCNGKCHLKKQLEKEDKKEQSPLGSIKDKCEILFFSDANSDMNLLHSFTKGSNSLRVDYSFHLSDKHLLSVFHPPQV